MLDEILARLGAMPEAERKELERAKEADGLRLIPNSGPQTDAYLSDADVLLYGGAAGGGKTAVLVGIAVQQHQRAIILRRESTELDGIEAFAKEIIGDDARFNGSDNVFTWPDGRSLKLGGCKEPDHWRKHAGRARDFMGFDEAGEFLEEQVASLMAWNRSPTPGQRCRIVLASNPPRGADGQWLSVWFAPWLDITFPNPAKPGELRYAIRVRGELRWVDGAAPVVIDGEEYRPLSYTFIPARLADNPYNDTPEYRAKLQSLPEPLRSQLLHGDFLADREDAAYQVIPTTWILQAQARWKADGWRDAYMTAMAYDPAGGGRDAAELCARHGGWYAEIVTVKGEETADGSASAATIIRHRRNNAPVVVDVGGGYGGAVTLRLKDNDIPHLRFNGAEGSIKHTKDGSLKFANKRAEAWWKFREELDPDQEGGSVIALPPDPELRADLAAPTYSVSARGIIIESKDDLRQRLGRSPGKGDVVVMALSSGDQAVKRQASRHAGALPTTANLGHAHLKRRR